MVGGCIHWMGVHPGSGSTGGGASGGWVHPGEVVGASGGPYAVGKYTHVTLKLTISSGLTLFFPLKKFPDFSQYLCYFFRLFL